MSDVGEFEEGIRNADRDDDIDSNDWNRLW